MLCLWDKRLLLSMICEGTLVVKVRFLMVLTENLDSPSSF